MSPGASLLQGAIQRLVTVVDIVSKIQSARLVDPCCPVLYMNPDRLSDFDNLGHSALEDLYYFLSRPERVAPQDTGSKADRFFHPNTPRTEITVGLSEE